MPIRQAQWGDLPAASSVLASAFYDEDLFGPVMHPHRHQYPTDVSLWFLRSLRQDFFNPCCAILISHPAGSPYTITGIAVWGRKGERGTHALRAEQTWRAWLCAKLIPLYNWVEARFWPNRAADPEMVDVLERSFPFIAHYWRSPERVENWYLQLCGSGPEFQGKGYGRELVVWGLQRAKREGVAASVISAKGKEGFYKKCGFGVLVGWASEGGEANPLHLVPGGAILWADVAEKQ